MKIIKETNACAASNFPLNWNEVCSRFYNIDKAKIKRPTLNTNDEDYEAKIRETQKQPYVHHRLIYTHTLYIHTHRTSCFVLLKSCIIFNAERRSSLLSLLPILFILANIFSWNFTCWNLHCIYQKRAAVLELKVFFFFFFWILISALWYNSFSLR